MLVLQSEGCQFKAHSQNELAKLERSRGGVGSREGKGGGTKNRRGAGTSFLIFLFTTTARGRKLRGYVA